MILRLPLWFYALAAMLVWVAAATGLAHHYHHEALQARSDAAEALQANRDNAQAIATLQAANQAWASKYAILSADGTYYTKAQNAYRDQLQAKLTAAQQQVQAIYARHPEARAWSTVPVPRDVADRLRAAGDR